LENTLKHTVNKRTAKISTSGIAIISVLQIPRVSRRHCALYKLNLLTYYLRKRCTVVSFSATAGILFLSCKSKIWAVWQVQ